MVPALRASRVLLVGMGSARRALSQAASSRKSGDDVDEVEVRICLYCFGDLPVRTDGAPANGRCKVQLIDDSTTPLAIPFF